MTEHWTLFYSWAVSNPAAATGIFISIVALAATIFQAHAARVQNKQSVRPYLNTVFELASVDGHDFVQLWISNVGLGPAIIDDFAIISAGRTYRGNAALNLITDIIEDCSITVLTPNGAIAAGEKHLLLNIKVHNEGLSVEEIQHFLSSEYELVVDYRSFMDQKARYTTRNHEFRVPLEE
ncbi:MAG: hypothetical protein HND56_07925 [Pseudomonadota bacterium]|nr:hypothetical protein [Pseudomonadota bacterium]QKK05617.1 MAG: hypothetical protein HND56_07925 [Pseudomonadota bacterium]